MKFETRRLGRTGLQVSPIGIGTGLRISADDLVYAFDQGINYFFYSTDLHHFAYRTCLPGLRKLCAAGSSTRSQVVLATVSYVNDPDKILGVLYDQFAELGVDYIDIFHWGWVTDRTDCPPLIEASRDVRDGGITLQRLRYLLDKMEVIQEVADDLRRRGLVRYIGASFHSRRQAAQCVPGPLDVLMVRYNVAHCGAESDVFPQLTGDTERDPGIVVFNVAHEGLRYFNEPDLDYPAGYPVPTIPDCYRFVLSNPHVDLVLAGLKNRAEIDAALRAVERGPLDPREMDFMRKYGLVFTKRAVIRHA